jgi:hypothetical protein
MLLLMLRDGGAAAPVEDRGLRRYMRRSLWRTGPTQRRPVVDRGAGGHQASSRSNGQAAERPEPELGLCELEPTHCWTAQPAEPHHSPAPTGVRSEMSDGQDCTTMGTTMSRVKRASDQDVPLREFLAQCTVTALPITLRDVLSHRFTLSLYNGVKS